MSGLEVRMTTDPAEALELAGPYLRTDPIEHNVCLTILEQRMKRPEGGNYWSVLDAGAVVSFMFRSPPTFKAGILAEPGPACRVLAEAAYKDAPELAGATGIATKTAAFAGEWSEVSGGVVEVVSGQRIYRLEALKPVAGVPGSLRAARPEDVDLVQGWIEAFGTETGSPVTGIPRPDVERVIADGRVYLWDHAGPVCIVRATEPVAGVGRVAMVFTPPEERAHGYAAASTAAVCEQIESRDHAQAILYTELCKPTPNAVYRRIGFKAVREVLVYGFARRL